MTVMNTRSLSLGLTLAMGAGIGAAQADQVINDDLIVTQSACIGQDCNNGESFGFDTLKLKENNLRIKFDDSSLTASFPSNDWQLTANDSGNGGANKFSIDDISNGRTPFTVEAGAPSHSLFIEDGGRIGFGTNQPVVTLHVKDGDTPTLRLEQDGSSGFTPQTYDLAANETNFFIRDVTNGSRLVFKIKPGAPTSSIFIAADGDVGLLTESPDANLHVIGDVLVDDQDLGAPAGTPPQLHVRSNDGDGLLKVEEASTQTAERNLLELSNNGGSYITITDTAPTRNTDRWFMTKQNVDDGDLEFTAELNNSGVFTLAFAIETDGDLVIGGALTENSDKNAKMAIEPVDTAEILEKVSALPVSAWTYKDDTSGARHVGPMAQDFYAMFGLGATETGISTLDTSGVALAAIQALNAKNAALEEQNALQQALIADLSARLDALESAVD